MSAESPDTNTAGAETSLEVSLSSSLAETEKLIQLIRDTSGEDLARFGSIDETLEEAAFSVSQIMAVFCGGKIAVEADGVAMFSSQFDRGEDEAPLCCARILMSDQSPVCHIAMTPAEFRTIIHAGFGTQDSAGIEDQQPLSFAEQKIFLRFCDRLCEDFFSTFLDADDVNVPMKPVLCDPGEVGEIMRGLEGVLTIFAAEVKGNEVRVRAVFPLELLDHNVSHGDDTASADEHEDARTAKRTVRWGEQMEQVISQVQIPLTAELAIRELPLAQVDALTTGPLPGFKFNMNNVRLLDADSMQVVSGSIHVRDGKLEFKVGKEMKRHAV